MSTVAHPASPALATIERRLYPRIVPHNPIYVAIDGKNQSLLLNISENGLLISSPVPLPRKLVTLTAIPLNGPLQPLLVNVRVVWTSESRMLAGIRLVDLTEYEREQIRRWGGQDSVLFPSPEIAKPAQVRPIATRIETDSPYESLRAEAKKAQYELPSGRTWLSKPASRLLIFSAALSLVATLLVAPRVYLVREILALLGILGLMAFIAVTFLVLAMSLWEVLRRAFSFIQKLRQATSPVDVEAPLQEILAEIPECAASPDLLRNP